MSSKMNGNAQMPADNQRPPPKKKLSVERVYQKKTQLEHILLRPDTYVGSVEFHQDVMWVYDGEESGMVQREVSYVPGLYKIFDEILVNAADNKQRDKKMDCIKIDIDQENNLISIWNNGKGIPVVEHKDEKMFVPTMIFGHLLTSSNYNDEEEKVTGGRNGYGAKLCNIFSNKFVVETSSKDYKKCFKQTWNDNMAKASEPKIKDYSGEDYTRITFSPDLSKFKMTSLEKDIVALMSRRAYDVAASTRGVRVFLNGKRLPVKNFKDYVDLYVKGKTDDVGNPIKIVYEGAGDRWEVAVCASDKGFQQISFVNSIATTKGGRHVDHVSDMIIKQMIDTVKKKNKGGVDIKPFQVRNHMWVFVNCLIVNPTFDSQTKENMTLQPKNFGSKCHLSEKFFASVAKCGIVEAVLSWAKFKAQTQLQKSCSSKKQTKLKGVPKLEDANDAGTRNSIDCTLILTEGDSAKTLAVSGLGVVGRDKFGVFPLRGKMLNVREATHKQILENAEINNIIKIVGLQYKKKYETTDDLKTLRYGKIMIMTDQDQDGSHIKGLLINFIHHNWPTLLKLPFLEEFITPIVKATKGKEEHSFFSLPEFEEWKKFKNNWHTYKVKYYKGLGTSTSKEAKEYFSDMQRHRIKFRYQGSQDDHAIMMAFSKKCVEQRKEWLTNWMVECKRRRELGLPELYLYEKDTTLVHYCDFVNKELVLFSNMDNERSIPCLVDGFKPGQRKILYTCIKRNDKREIKVAQLAGSVAEQSAYHHGEVSLMSTIISLAQNYVGSNNINILQPIGQFGTRLQGGKDHASPRYIFTMLSPLARHIFHPHDDALLHHLHDDNQKIEPEWYIPILPMVLVNGADGIGTGWMTKIPNYNPREIVQNLLLLLRGEELRPMNPWYKGFKGEVESLGYQKYVTNGEVAVLSANRIEITELPVHIWTQTYKESVLEPMLHGNEKTPSLVSDYKEYHTDKTVRFVVSMPEDKLLKAEEESLHKVLKLQSTMSTTSMVLFDANGCLKRYECVEDILREFYDLRLDYYKKRKAYLEGMLKAEALKLSNQARFILEKCDGVLVVERKKKKEIIAELVKKGYDSDPVKSWKLQQNKEAVLEEASEQTQEEDEGDSAEDGKDYDYLMCQNMWTLTEERMAELLRKRDEKQQELKVLQGKSTSQLWTDDLSVFLEQLDTLEKKEEEEDNEVPKGKGAKGKGAGGPRGKKAALETMPSPMARRIAPQIGAELRKKVEKAAAAKENKGKRAKKDVEEEKDDIDMLVEGTKSSLRESLGNSPEMIEKKNKRKKVGDGLKQTKLNFQSKPRKNSKSSSSDDDFPSDSEPPVKRSTRKAAGAKVNYNIDFDSSDESRTEAQDHSGEKESGQRKEDMIAVSDTDSEFEVRPSKKPAAKASAVVVSSSDEESAPKKAPKPLEDSNALFDSLLMGGGGGNSSSSINNGSANQKDDSGPLPRDDSPAADSSSDEVSPTPPRPAPKPRGRKPAASKPPKAGGENRAAKSKKAPPKRKVTSDSEDDDDAKPKKTQRKKVTSSSDEEMPELDGGDEKWKSDIAPREGGRARKPISYKFDDSDESDY